MMESRFIFLPLVKCFHKVTKDSTLSRLWDFCLWRQALTFKVRASAGETRGASHGNSSEHPSQKSFMDMSLMSPYRKPTQVGWR